MGAGTRQTRVNPMGTSHDVAVARLPTGGDEEAAGEGGGVGEELVEQRPAQAIQSVLVS